MSGGPDAGDDADASSPDAGDVDMVQVSVSTDAPVTDTVDYVIAGPDGATFAPVALGAARTIELDVPVGGSITERRRSALTPSLNVWFTTTGIAAGDSVDFRSWTRLPRALGIAHVTLPGAPAGTYRVVGPCASGVSDTGDVAVQVFDNGCTGSLVAVTLGDDPQVATTSTVIDAGASFAFAGVWSPVLHREVTVTGLPAGGARYHAALFDGRIPVIDASDQELGDDGTATITDIPGAGLDDVEWLEVSAGPSVRTWSVKQPHGLDRAVELLPELAAPTLDGFHISWQLPEGVAADAPVLVQVGQGWWLTARAGDGGLTIPTMMSEPPGGATVTVIEAGRMTASDARRAPRIVLGLSNGGGAALAGFASTRTTSAKVQ